MLRFRKGQIDWKKIRKDNFSKMATRDENGDFRLKEPYNEQFRMYAAPELMTEYISFNMNDDLVGKNKALRQPSGTPMANAFVSLLQALGHDDIQHFGDSTGEFPLSFPRGSAVSQVGA